MFQRYAWPSANWGSMHIAGGAAAAYRREIEAADDPDAARREIIFTESWGERSRNRRMRVEEMEGTVYLAYYPHL